MSILKKLIRHTSTNKNTTMQQSFAYKKILPHLLVILGFVITSLAYFHPVLTGKKITQSDIVQYTGMARQQTDFRNETGEEPYWTDSAFGGMPTYQLGARYPHYYIKKLDKLIRFLPRPSDYLFLYFMSFYVLLLVLKVEYRLAFIGSLAFGFSTYMIIILGVGHNAKAHAIGYMPMVLSGIILIFRQKHIFGFLLLTVAMALELVANHIQMTYYLGLLVVILGIVYFVDAFKKKGIPSFFRAIGVMVLAVGLAVLMNATNLLATKEYADQSTRGKSALTINSDGSQKTATGLDYSYITEYSYGVLESFNLFIPRFMGGSSSEKLDTDSESYEALLKMGVSPLQAKGFLDNAPTYWGRQPFVGAPAYLGATVVFLFVLALFLVQGKLKWWLLAGTLMSLVLSWGDNFAIITNLFINYVPMYNKFRAVSSIQVLLELCIPVLAVVGLQRFFGTEIAQAEKLKALKYSVGIVGGIAVVFLFGKSTLFSFSGGADAGMNQQMGADFVRALREDRKAIFTTDTLRSLVLVLLVVASCWALLVGKLKEYMAIAAIGIVVLFDLVGVARRYVNTDNFVSKRVFSQPFQKNSADAKILSDKEHFRVYDVTRGPFNTGRTSYFHNALGGYHAAKPGRIQDIYDFYLAKGNTGVLNMFNVKYLIVNEKEKVKALQNPDANGNAWFVDSLMIAQSANEEILSLKKLDTKQKAVISVENATTLGQHAFVRDTTSRITLVAHQPNKLTYKSQNSNAAFAVFSEVYYPYGWQAYIDEQPVTHHQVNYVLRGLEIPAGEHEIVFRFDPQVIKTGSTITLASSVLFVLLLIGGVYYESKKNKMDS